MYTADAIYSVHVACAAAISCRRHIIIMMVYMCVLH